MGADIWNRSGACLSSGYLWKFQKHWRYIYLAWGWLVPNLTSKRLWGHRWIENGLLDNWGEKLNKQIVQEFHMIFKLSVFYALLNKIDEIVWSTCKQSCKKRQIWQIYLCYFFQGGVNFLNVSFSLSLNSIKDNNTFGSSIKTKMNVIFLLLASANLIICCPNISFKTLFS